MHFDFCWYDDGTNAYRWIFLNGEILASLFDTTQQSAIDSTLRIGNQGATGSNEVGGILDNIKLIDGCLLPYGAYFTGNGAVDTDVAHEDILVYLIGSEAETEGTTIGNFTINFSDVPSEAHVTDIYGNAESAVDFTSSNYDGLDFPCNTTNGAINIDEGTLSLFINNANLNNYIYSHTQNSSAFYLRYLDATTVRTYTNGDLWQPTVGINMWDGGLHHIRYTWNHTLSLRRIYIDGILQATNTSSWTQTYDLSSGNLVIGNSGIGSSDGSMAIFEKIFITNKFETPQIPVILGSGPIYMPIK